MQKVNSEILLVVYKENTFLPQAYLVAFFLGLRKFKMWFVFLLIINLSEVKNVIKISKGMWKHKYFLLFVLISVRCIESENCIFP